MLVVTTDYPDGQFAPDTNPGCAGFSFANIIIVTKRVVVPQLKNMRHFYF